MWKERADEEEEKRNLLRLRTMMMKMMMKLRKNDITEKMSMLPLKINIC